MPQTRRQFLKLGVTAGVTVMANHSASQEQSAATVNLGVVKLLRTPILEIAYEEHGDPEGFPIILLHGFPYDVRAFDGVVPLLATGRYRVVVPYLRGYGLTRFLSPDSPRMAEQAALAQDVLDFCDALSLEEVALAGFDWGNRAACIAAIVAPTRVRAQVAIGGYSVQITTRPGNPAPAVSEARLWYQWYFNTERGRQGLETNRHDIIRYLWETWSPGWTYSDEDYQRSAPSFDNPDFVDLVIHSYRHRHNYVPGEDRFLELEQRLAERPPIEVPAIVLRGAESGFGAPSQDPTRDQATFPRLVDRRIVSGAGHDLPVQRPDAVAAALNDLLMDV